MESIANAKVLLEYHLSHLKVGLGTEFSIIVFTLYVSIKLHRKWSSCARRSWKSINSYAPFKSPPWGPHRASPCPGALSVVIVATLNQCARYAAGVVVSVDEDVGVAAVATVSAITPTDVMTTITTPAVIINATSVITTIAVMLAHRTLEVAAEVVVAAAAAVVVATTTAVAMIDAVSTVGRHETSRMAGTINTTITPKRCGRRVK